jgi:hypothetical protein
MYIWKINELKKLIVERGLSEAQVFYYVLLFVGFSVVGIELMAYFPYEDPNVWNYLQSCLNFTIPIVGTIAAYHANGGAKGKSFAAKYFSISFVVLVRFLVYLIPVMVALFVYYALSSDWSSLENDETFQTGWVEVVPLSVWYAALYGAVVKHIRDTAKA